MDSGDEEKMKAIVQYRLFCRTRSIEYEFNGVRIVDVPECFGVGMGIVLSPDCDPQIPDAIYSNSVGSLVIYFEAEEISSERAKDSFRHHGFVDASSLAVRIEDAEIADVQRLSVGF